jgi:DNA-binding IclR family transcriptional regulator
MDNNLSQTPEKNSGTQTILRAAKILNSFTEEKPEWSFTDLSTHLKINQSTLSRLINTMESIGWIERNSETNKLRVGLQVSVLAFTCLYQYDLRRISLPILEELSKKTKLSTTLAVFNSSNPIYIARVEEQTNLFPGNYVLGRVAPLHCSAVGKVLLASLDKIKREEMIKSLDFKKYTENTIQNIEELNQQLSDCIENGFGMDISEWVPEIGSIASPVRDKYGEVAGAIAISGSIEKINSLNTKHLIDEVILSANKLSYSIGDVRYFS